MKTRRIPLAIAVATALLTPTTAAYAAALGEIAALSALGERFRAEIRLVGNETVQAGCFRVVAPASAAPGIPALDGGRVSIAGHGANARLVVSEDRTVSDPVIQLALENVCEARLRREYTLLMPFTAASPAGTLGTAAPERNPAAARTGPAAQRSAPAKPTRPSARKAAARTWSTADGESLQSLGEALYPDDPVARERFSQATAAANPRLFPNAAAHDRPLPAGTRVIIPDLRRVASTAPDPVAPTSSPVANQPMSLPARASGDRVVVDKSVGPEHAAKARSSAAAGGAATGDERAAALLERERELAAAIDRSIVAEMELIARIKELEELQAALEQRLRSRLNTPQAAQTPPPAAQVAAAAAAVAPQPAATAPAQTTSPVSDAYLFAGLGAAALLLTALLLRRRRGEHAAAGGIVPPSPSVPGRAYEPQTVTNAGFTAEAIDTSRVDEAAPSIMRAPTTGDATVTEEHKSAIELADIMMSFGRVQGAAETLAEFIRGNPREAVTPWLKLLEVYRAAGLRAEFDAIAGELNKTFNVNAVNWDNYQLLRAARTSLEDLPHITETLQKSWRTTACQRYLQQLLRDNRDGTRVGFPFTVIDEILTLSAILEEELGPLPRTNGGRQPRR